MKVLAIAWGSVGVMLMVWATVLIWHPDPTVSPFQRLMGLLVGCTAVMVARQAYRDSNS